MTDVYNNIPDGPSYPDVELPDLRIDASESDDPDKQRKANYGDPECRYARAMEFINRKGSAFDRLEAKASYCVKADEYFKFDYEVETMKRAYRELGYSPSEIRDMFNNCNSSTHGFIVRELACRVDGLYPQHMKLRRCPASSFYPQLEESEDTAYMGYNTEEIGE